VRNGPWRSTGYLRYCRSALFVNESCGRMASKICRTKIRYKIIVHKWGKREPAALGNGRSRRRASNTWRGRLAKLMLAGKLRSS
jgi:hypothetical protein